VPSATFFCFVIQAATREGRAAKRRRVKPMLYAVVSAAGLPLPLSLATPFHLLPTQFPRQLHWFKGGREEVDLSAGLTFAGRIPWLRSKVAHSMDIAIFGSRCAAREAGKYVAANAAMTKAADIAA
jgi:hypothetical protein